MNGDLDLNCDFLSVKSHSLVFAALQRSA